MQGEADGSGPVCGARPSQLGVRPAVDVRVDRTSFVRLQENERRGLSVAPAPAALPPAYRPRGLHAGESVLPCWRLEVSSLSDIDGVHLVRTKPNHGVIATREDAHIDVFQRRLCQTKDRWEPWGR